jgi:hypothetical protein
MVTADLTAAPATIPETSRRGGAPFPMRITAMLNPPGHDRMLVTLEVIIAERSRLSEAEAIGPRHLCVAHEIHSSGAFYVGG